jgi:hypothetical protein
MWILLKWSALFLVDSRGVRVCWHAHFGRVTATAFTLAGCFHWEVSAAPVAAQSSLIHLDFPELVRFVWRQV